MSPRLPKTALVDTGFWYALLDDKDDYHKAAKGKEDSLFRLSYVIPWPVMYETLCTRFVRRPHLVASFERILSTPAAVRLDEAKYREDALFATLSHAKTSKRSISLVDSVLRMIVEDRSVRVDCLYTFNPGDFADVCRRRGIEMR